MGTPKVMPQEIEKMYILYKKLGAFAAVGKELHRSPSTIAKYIKAGGMKNLSITIAKNIKEES